MTDGQLRVTFEPHGRAVFVLPGTKVMEAAARAGMAVETPCGGNGTCGKCRLRVVSGACEPTQAERDLFTPEELSAGWRLACQSGLYAPAVIHVPESSLFAGQQRILTEDRTEAGEVHPAVRKTYVELPAPTLADCAADLLRIERATGPLEADLDVLRGLPDRLRQNAFRGTAVVADRRLIDFEPGDTTAHCYGAAFDIGTTTLVGSLLNLRDGDELAIASRINPQVSLGDDVVSRIQYSTSGPRCLAELRDLVLKAVGEMLLQMCQEVSVRREHVYELSFAGNTTMQHLLCGIGVRQLGELPFAPAHARGLVIGAGELGVAAHPRAAAYVFPVVGGFVGGDTVAGILATRLTAKEGPVLLVDIGTNGEIVLWHAGRLWAASTAAGPAFEGARISCGMRATTGAIEKIVLDGEMQCSVIGDVEPIGLCGSALVDVAAQLLDLGIVTSDGRLLPPGELPAGLDERLRRRLRAGPAGQTEFLLWPGDGSDREARVRLTQRDVRELQLATGAIRAGIAVLLRQAGVAGTDLQRVLIAGGFGSFIRRNHAQRIGLIPTDVHHSRIQFVGNTSLAGARLALMSTEARAQAEELARKAQHVELSQDPNFQAEFAEAMIFPDRGGAA